MKGVNLIDLKKEYLKRYMKFGSKLDILKLIKDMQNKK